MSIFTNPAAGAGGSAQAYIDATLTLLGDDDPLTVLRQGPSAFEELMNGSSPDDLRLPEAPGKWSAAALAQHMADSEMRSGNAGIGEMFDEGPVSHSVRPW